MKADRWLRHEARSFGYSMLRSMIQSEHHRQGPGQVYDGGVRTQLIATTLWQTDVLSDGVL